MDFTYLLAAALSLVVGLIAAIPLALDVFARPRLAFALTVAIATFLNLAILINWRALTPGDLDVLAIDLAIFGAVAFVGVAAGAIVGTLPILVLRGLLNAARRLLARFGHGSGKTGGGEHT